MFVCSCRVVSDEVIRHAIDQGAQTVEEITAGCGAGGGCGACRETLERLLDAGAPAAMAPAAMAPAAMA